MAEWHDLPWTLRGGSATAVQDDAPAAPQFGDVWLDTDDDAGGDLPDSGLGELTSRVGTVETALDGLSGLPPRMDTAEQALVGLGEIPARVTATEQGLDVLSPLPARVSATERGLDDLVPLAGRVTAVEEAVVGPRSVTHAAALTLTPRSGVWVDRVQWSVSGNTTVTPAGGVDGQVLRLVAHALGGVTVTFPAGVRLSTGLTERVYPVPAGQVLIAALERAAGFYVLTAATVSG